MLQFENWLYSQATAEKRLHVITTAMVCDRDPAKNRQRIAEKVNRYMDENPDTDLIVFGEMILGWYDPLGLTAYHHSLSETIPGETTELLGNLARDYGIYLCCGLSEAAEEGYHNSQVLINPQGEIQSVHRKWNLKAAERQIGYKPGPHPVTVTDIKGVKTGIIICADAAHPGTMRELIRSDLDLILYSMADDKDEKWFMAKAMARLTDAWLVSANRFGQETSYWNGHLTVSDPLGKLREVSIDREGCLVQTIRVADDRSGAQRFLRHVVVKTPLIIHIMRNWRILKSYY